MSMNRSGDLLSSPIRRPGGSGVAVPSLIADEKRDRAPRALAHSRRPAAKEEPMDPIALSRLPVDPAYAALFAVERPRDDELDDLRTPGTAGCEATPLAVAAWNGDQVSSRLIVSARPDALKARDEDGLTPFTRAFVAGLAAANPGLVRCCDAGRDKGNRQIDPISPLARSLLEAGSDPSAADYFGRSALHYAAISGEVTAVAWVVEALAAKESRDRTQLVPAKKHHHVACLGAGGDEEGDGSDRGDDAEETLSFYRDAPRPACADDEDMARVYRDLQDDADALSSLGAPSVASGAYYSRPSGVGSSRAGYSSSGNVNNNSSSNNKAMAGAYSQRGGFTRSIGSSSAMTPAAMLGVREMAGAKEERERARQSGRRVSPHIDARDAKGQTALCLAAARGHASVASVLMSTCKVDPGAPDSIGWTPLHHAVHNGHASCARLLVAAGAAITAVDVDGWAPVHRAAARGDIACLRASLADFKAPAGSDASAKRDPLAVPRLLSLQTRTDGSTALHLACAGPHPTAAKYLLDLGADPRGGAARRRTPLYEAANAGSETIVRLLVARGAIVGPMEQGAARTEGVRRAMGAGNPGGFSFAAAPHAR